MDEIVKEFLIESRENLDRMDQELVRLESEPSSKELLASIFRTIHTIKGSCGFLGFGRLEKVSHAGESLLSRLRDGHLALTAAVTSGLLAMVDAVRHMLGEIEATEHDGEDEYAELQGELKRLQEAEQKAPKASAVRAVAEAGAAQAIAALPPAPVAVAEAPPSRQSTPVQDRMGGVLVEQGVVGPEDVARALQLQQGGDPRRLGEILVGLGLAKPEEVLAAQQVLESRARELAMGETVRVGVTLLNKLMNLVGELVLARNQLLQFSHALPDAGFQAVSQRLNLIASELQEEVMKTRMQAIGKIWNKFPRTVRDMAVNSGKEVRLEMEGEDVELDRTIVEAIKDPLTHLVRNSVDHGIETPEARRAAGKDGCGCLRLRAFHEGGQVNIEISDDGAGLNCERIRKKAVERGLISAQEASRLQDREVFKLIFLPGFSTAESVTNLSGRGVGMDVVKTNVEKIGGVVDVQSVLGQGTTVRVKIPLTLAIIPVLIVTCHGDRFAIPQVSLRELVRLEAGDGGKGVERVHGAPVYRLRGRLLPLVYLDQELSLAREADAGTSAPAAANIVVLQAEDREFGLVVDEINDTEEILVKPMGKRLKSISAYSGATIMGDGRVVLILDVLGLAQGAKVLSGAHTSEQAEKHRDARPEGRKEGRGNHGNKGRPHEHAVLLAENGRRGRVAIPLSMVARLEEFPASVAERAGDREVMQYRGQIMPLVRLAEVLPDGDGAGEPAPVEGSIHVLVYSGEGRAVGLVVDRIVDIVEEHAAVEPLGRRAGVLGSFVAQHRVTELLDVPAIIREAVPGLLQGAAAEAGQGQGQR